MGIGRDEGGWVFVGRKRVSGGPINLEMVMESNLWKCNGILVWIVFLLGWVNGEG